MKKCFLKIIKHSGEIGKSILYDEDFKTSLPIIDKLSEKKYWGYRQFGQHN